MATERYSVLCLACDRLCMASVQLFVAVYGQCLYGLCICPCRARVKTWPVFMLVNLPVYLFALCLAYERLCMASVKCL